MFTVSLDLRPGGARVAIIDRGGPDEPSIAAPNLDRPGGRGLVLIEHLTDGRWGWDGDTTGRRVWAEMIWKPDTDHVERRSP